MKRNSADKFARARVLREFEDLGATERSAGVISFPLSETVVGLIQLNVAESSAEYVDYFPGVAVVNLEVGRILDFLQPSQRSMAVAPSLSAKLSYLMSDPKYEVWRVYWNSGLGDQLESLVGVLRKVGIPFLRNLANIDFLLESSLAAARNENIARSYVVNSDFLVPAIFCMKGEYCRAIEYWMNEVVTPDPNLPTDYDEYGRRLRELTDLSLKGADGIR